MINVSKYQLYLILDPNFCKFYSILDVVRLAIAGGVTCVQLRNKVDTKEVILKQAKALKESMQGTDVPLIINDHVSIAKAIDADGVHLGQSDINAFEAREQLGPDKIIGLSTSRLEQLYEVDDTIVDYCGVGPIYDTTSKKCDVPIWEIAQLTKAIEIARLPLVAIGGINIENISTVMQTGVAGTAILSAICSAKNPLQVTQLMRAHQHDYT